LLRIDRTREFLLKRRTGLFQPLFGLLERAVPRHKVSLSHTPMFAYHPHANKVSVFLLQVTWRMIVASVRPLVRPGVPMRLRQRNQLWPGHLHDLRIIWSTYRGTR